VKRLIILFLLFAPTIDAQQVRVSNKNSSLTVYAGPDQTITLPSVANLSGKATALPSRLTVTTNWGVISGPAAVVFSNINSVSSTAAFSIPGVYVLSLNASTSRLNASSNVTITVNPEPVSVPSTVTVAMAWDASASANGYNVWRLTEGGAWLKLGVTTETTWTDSTVVSGTTYYYSVKAFNDVGESESSNLLKVLR
jgi:hypothetical protein